MTPYSVSSRPHQVSEAHPALKAQAAPRRAALVLSDGEVFLGRSFGATGIVYGELVFNTAMTGYQEVLTDPSYTGQLVTLTHPHIGNTGIQPTDNESHRPRLSALLVSKATRLPSHPRAALTLEEYLLQQDIIGIERLDTRRLVRHVRSFGAQPAMITTEITQDGSLELPSSLVDELVGSLETWKAHASGALAMKAGTQRPYTIAPGEHVSVRGAHKLIVAYDFGLKRAIVEQLAALGCKVLVVPANFPADAVLRLKPDGVFLSNGPGDPRELLGPIEAVKGLLGKVPLFGICLGHQLLALAMGAEVEKLSFGHRGANHPVMELATGRIEITSQNHGYHVVADSLPEEVEATHINLNDRTLEGLSHRHHDAFSVQYHPEARPGPHDAHRHFLRFLDRVCKP